MKFCEVRPAHPPGGGPGRQDAFGFEGSGGLAGRGGSTVSPSSLSLASTPNHEEASAGVPMQGHLGDSGTGRAGDAEDDLETRMRSWQEEDVMGGRGGVHALSDLGGVSPMYSLIVGERSGADGGEEGEGLWGGVHSRNLQAEDQAVAKARGSARPFIHSPKFGSSFAVEGGEGDSGEGDVRTLSAAILSGLGDSRKWVSRGSLGSMPEGPYCRRSPLSCGSSSPLRASSNASRRGSLSGAVPGSVLVSSSVGEVQESLRRKSPFKNTRSPRRRRWQGVGGSFAAMEPRRAKPHSSYDDGGDDDGGTPALMSPHGQPEAPVMGGSFTRALRHALPKPHSSYDEGLGDEDEGGEEGAHRAEEEEGGRRERRSPGSKRPQKPKIDSGRYIATTYGIVRRSSLVALEVMHGHSEMIARDTTPRKREWARRSSMAGYVVNGALPPFSAVAKDELTGSAGDSPMSHDTMSHEARGDSPMSHEAGSTEEEPRSPVVLFSLKQDPFELNFTKGDAYERVPLPVHMEEGGADDEHQKHMHKSVSLQHHLGEGGAAAGEGGRPRGAVGGGDKSQSGSFSARFRSPKRRAGGGYKGMLHPKQVGTKSALQWKSMSSILNPPPDEHSDPAHPRIISLYHGSSSPSLPFTRTKSTGVNARVPWPECDEEEFQRGKALLRTLDLDALTFQPDTLVHLALEIFEELDLPAALKLPVEKLQRFILAVRGRMYDNPYHNFWHVFDVTQTAYALGLATGMIAALAPMEKFALIVAALCHDLEHPGVNNMLLVHSLDTDTKFRDKLSLEKHHSLRAFELLVDHDIDLLQGLNTMMYYQFRDCVVKIILATDMSKHAQYMQRISAARESFNHELHKPWSCESAAASRKDLRREYAQLGMEVLIKCSDTSNVIKPFAVAKKWAHRVTEEFFKQGDMEKTSGLEVSKTCDREKETRVGLQKGFIDYLTTPFYELCAELFPNMDKNLQRMRDNRRMWDEYSDERLEAECGGYKQQQQQQQAALALG